MQIDIGSRVIVEFSRQERLTSQFVGASRDEFVLLKVPMTAGIRDRLAEGAYLQFRYLQGGKIIGFGAEVLRYQAAPVSLAFLSYPTEFSEYNLRREGRVECLFPTEIAVAGTTCDGRIVDISASGCQFIFDDGAVPNIEDKDSIAGSFTTMEGSRKYAFKGVVMARQVRGTMNSLGIKFDEEIEVPEIVQERLRQIESVKDLRERGDQDA